MAREQEILITLGAQNALFLLARLLVQKGTPVAMEEPGLGILLKTETMN